MRICCGILILMLAIAPTFVLAGDKEVKLACVVGDGTLLVGKDNKDEARVGTIRATSSWAGNVRSGGSMAAECNAKYPVGCDNKCWACRDYDVTIMGMTNMGCYGPEGQCNGWCPPY